MELNLENAIEYLKEIRNRSKKFKMIYPSSMLEDAIRVVIEEIENEKNI